MRSIPNPSPKMRIIVLSLSMFSLLALTCLFVDGQCPGPGLACPPLSDGSPGGVINCSIKKIQANITPYVQSYMEVKPADFESNPTRKYPLLVYLGGTGEQFQIPNSNTLDLCHTLYWSMPSRINSGQFPSNLVYNSQSYSYFVVMPFLRGSTDVNNPYWYDPIDPGAVIDYMLAHYPGRIDVNRIYLTGMSRGTEHIMGWLSQSVDNAKRIAAAFIVANCYPSLPYIPDFNQRVANLAAGGVHIWGLSCTLDQACSPQAIQDYVNGINAIHPGQALYTGYTDPPDGSVDYCQGPNAKWHYAWNYAYSPEENRPAVTGGKNPYEWMIQFSQNTILPVTLKNWTARLDNDKVLLQWTTSNEFNTKQFVIQRANVNGNFQDILTVPAAIASSSEKKYTLVDNQPIKGTGLYRLVAYDQDGKSTIFDTRRVSLADKWSGNVLIPNPVTDGQLSVYIKVDRTQQVTFRLVDLTGRVLQQQSKQVSTGRSQYIFGVSAVQKGVYLVQIIGEDFKTAEKVSIE